VLRRFYYDEFGNTTYVYNDGTAALGDERTHVLGYGNNQNKPTFIVGNPDYEADYSGTGTSGPLMKQTSYCYDLPVSYLGNGFASCPSSVPTKAY
jgi:hypothetical protein